MIHLGDITKINGATVPPVDIICGGSPCQDLSVAGKRAGLAGERSGLFMDQIRVIKEMRENDRANGRADVDIRPRFMVWENVPGAFTSNNGEDFRAVLEETARVADSSASIPRLPKGEGWSNSGAIVGDGWSIAWRVHDAQFWGVPQRRKRISLVADFAGGGALEVLFERDGLQGDLEPGESARKDIARDAQGGSRETSRALSFQERAGKPGGGKGILIQDEHTGALSTVQNQSVCYGISSMDSNAMKSDNPHSGIYEAETSRTLDPNGANPACNQGGIAVVAIEGNGARPSHKGDGFSESETMYTLNSVEQHAVAYRKQGHPQSADQGQGWEQTDVNDTLNAFDTSDARTPTVIVDGVWDARGKGDGKTVPSLVGDHQRRITDLTAIVMDAYQHHGWRESETVGTITARQSKGVGGDTPPCVEQQAVFGQSSFGDFSTDSPPLRAQGGDYGGGSENLAVQQSIVRRLTPLECERLQGYPDGWTDIGDWVDSKGKKHKPADAPRYKALGNSIALPFWQWLAERMVALIEHDSPTMASLFDGISGFCLVFARSGCRPVWASEIEEFPIAVAKRHFGDDDTGEVGDYEKYL